MSVLQNGPKGARWASFGFAVTVFGLLPTEIGYQDIAALLARQPGVTERWQKHAMASSFGTIHAATFSFPRPIGFVNAARAGRSASRACAAMAAISPARSRAIRYGHVIRPPQPHEFPIVDRSAKGDRLSSKGDRLTVKPADAEIAVVPQPVLPEDEAGAPLPARRCERAGRA